MDPYNYDTFILGYCKLLLLYFIMDKIFPYFGSVLAIDMNSIKALFSSKVHLCCSLVTSLKESAWAIDKTRIVKRIVRIVRIVDE